MLGLALLMLLASPGAADVGREAFTQETAAGSDQLAALERKLGDCCDRIEGVLAELKRLDAAFPTSNDPEALLARRAALAEEYVRLNQEEDDLHGSYRQLREALRLVVLSHGLDGAMKGRLHAEADGTRLFVHDKAAQQEDSRRDRIYDAARKIEEGFVPLLHAYHVRHAERRRNAVIGGIGAALLACAALLARPARAPLPAPPPAPALPRVVARNFSVTGLLGRGAMGEVYEAVDTSLGRRTALKRLRPELLQDPAELEGLLKEARLMASLKHPNLVSIYSVEKDAGQVYLALEFVDGVTLQARLDQERRLPWPEALRIAQGVGAALDYAHDMKVVHRDLKPANVMLSSKGEVKVMDFGIAHQAPKSVSRLTRAPAWGTPAYMAPEQELGGLSAAVDLYALSVCLYEMLTGELPFKGPNFLAQKRESLWTPPSRLVPGLPAGSDGLFAVALAPEPSRRFPSAAALLAAAGRLPA